jgi:hypothetical protein
LQQYSTRKVRFRRKTPSQVDALRLSPLRLPWAGIGPSLRDYRKVVHRGATGGRSGEDRIAQSVARTFTSAGFRDILEVAASELDLG